MDTAKRVGLKNKSVNLSMCDHTTDETLPCFLALFLATDKQNFFFQVVFSEKKRILHILA